MEWVQIIIGFITGGGLLTLINLRLNRKSADLDYTQKFTAFFGEENKKLVQRIEDLEKKVEELINYKCTDMRCTKRQPPKQ